VQVMHALVLMREQPNCDHQIPIDVDNGGKGSKTQVIFFQSISNRPNDCIRNSVILPNGVTALLAWKWKMTTLPTTQMHYLIRNE
jgi:hypothetical protein